MRVLRLCLALIVLGATVAVAQEAAASDPRNIDADAPADLQQVVNAQFGPCFKVVHQRSVSVKYLHMPPDTPQWVSFLATDLNNDGVEDAVIVARCKDVLADQDAFEYQVQDPMFEYHGYGDPKVTSTFSSADPQYGNVVLIIHGVGEKGWRTDRPAAKFVVINLEFDTLHATKVNRGNKKKRDLVGAIHVEGKEGNGSSLFYDGKKYRWRETAGGRGSN